MIDQITSITVEDIRKQALPLGTRVIAGDGHLGQSVTWATVIYGQPSSTRKTRVRSKPCSAANLPCSPHPKAMVSASLPM